MSDWDDQLICKVNRPELADLAGRSIGEIARERGQAPMDTALDLVLEDGQFWIAPTIKSQDHLDRLIASPLCVPIGDGFAHHPERHKAYGIMPKSFGTFPLVLGSYARDRGVLSLPDAIRKITSEPARRLGLADRGTLAEGYAADLVVFDPRHHRQPSRRRGSRGPPGRHRPGHGQRRLGRDRRRGDRGADRRRPLGRYSQSGKLSRRSRAAPSASSTEIVRYGDSIRSGKSSRPGLNRSISLS